MTDIEKVEWPVIDFTQTERDQRFRKMLEEIDLSKTWMKVRKATGFSVHLPYIPLTPTWYIDVPNVDQTDTRSKSMRWIEANLLDTLMPPQHDFLLHLSRTTDRHFGYGERRRSGMTTIALAYAIYFAVERPGSTIWAVSSNHEMVRHNQNWCVTLLRDSKMDTNQIKRDNPVFIHFPNGSRIRFMSHDNDVAGFDTANLMILDDALAPMNAQYQLSIRVRTG